MVCRSADQEPDCQACWDTGGSETFEMTDNPHATVQDRVMTTMNDRSGYFLLNRPKTGWTPGLYRCGLFAGERASAYTSVDEVRFRIVESR